MSQVDAMVEIKAKAPVAIHPTYAWSQWMPLKGRASTHMVG